MSQLVKIVRQKKRLGRGVGSRGAKSGRGMKGQRSRAGYSARAGFEGGQTPLYQRLPKGRGAKQSFSSQVKKPLVVTVAKLDLFDDGAIVGPGALRDAGMSPRRVGQVKLIGGGTLSKKLTVRAHKVTESARSAVEAAGGKVEIINF